MHHRLTIYFSILVVCLNCCAPAIAQDEINVKALRLVDSANAAFCRNDTAATIAILENVEKLYPTDGTVAASNKALAELYIAQGRTKEAKEKIWYGISYKRTTTVAVTKEIDGCAPLFTNSKWLYARAESCVCLSQLYLQEKQFDSSLYYLKLAESKFNPYQGCGNGYIGFRVYVSPYFADHYLAMGDTTKAINHLLDFFMQYDGNIIPVTKKLKALLLQKYTRQQITAEVRKGLRKISFTKTDYNDDSWYMNITMFGHTTKYYEGSGSYLKSMRKFYRNAPAPKMLCNAK